MLPLLSSHLFVDAIYGGPSLTRPLRCAPDVMSPLSAMDGCLDRQSDGAADINPYCICALGKRKASMPPYQQLLCLSVCARPSNVMYVPPRRTYVTSIQRNNSHFTIWQISIIKSLYQIPNMPLIGRILSKSSFKTTCLWKKMNFTSDLYCIHALGPSP